MKLSSLAAKQKRAKDWLEFVQSEAVEEQLKKRTAETVARFRELLASCWERQEIRAEDEASINDLERQLELLNEEARLAAKPPPLGRPGVFNGRQGA